MKGFILTLMVILGFAGATVAQPSMEDIVKKWDERRGSITSAKYVIEEIATSYPDKRFTAPGATGERKTTSTRTLIVNLRTGEFRNEKNGEVWDAGRAAVVPYRGATVFREGKLYSIRWPNEGQSGVGKDVGRVSDYAEIRGNLASQEFRNELFPVFFDLGIVPLSSGHALIPGSCHKYSGQDFADAIVPARRRLSTPQVTWYALIASGTGRNLMEGEFAVEHGKSQLVSGYEKRQQASKTNIKTAIVHKQLPAGAWATSSWTTEVFLNDALLSVHRMRVISCDKSYGAQASDFELTPAAGMIVSKTEIPDSGSNLPPDPVRTDYRVGASGELLPLQVPTGGWLSRYRGSLLLGGILVFCAAYGVYVWRIKRKR